MFKFGAVFKLGRHEEVVLLRLIIKSRFYAIFGVSDAIFFEEPQKWSEKYRNGKVKAYHLQQKQLLFNIPQHWSVIVLSLHQFLRSKVCILL